MKEIHNYINKQYSNWFDFANYQATQAKIPDDAEDILNEVILNILEKPKGDLIRLFEQKGQGRTATTKNMVLTGLDFMVLRLIRLYATSNTAPWRHAKKRYELSQPIPAEKPDETEESVEELEQICTRVNSYFALIDNTLILSPLERVCIKTYLINKGYDNFKGERNFIKTNVQKAKNRIKIALTT